MTLGHRIAVATVARLEAELAKRDQRIAELEQFIATISPATFATTKADTAQRR